MNITGELEKLNDAQRAAVDSIDGPLLVIAGPGTGKTQLLSARVANILQQTDTLPQNILCLTFTESGAENMRERLTRFIGQAAYDVTISTYHAFGGDLIRRYPEYFSETRMQEPIDDLGRHQILQSIVDGMSYLNPIKQTRHHLGDLISTLSEVKRALLTGNDLRALAQENAAYVARANQQLLPLWTQFSRMPSKVDAAMPYFVGTLEIIKALLPATPANPSFPPLARVAGEELMHAIEQADSTGKTTFLTVWKNKWLSKDTNNNFIMAGELENNRMIALADVLESYQAALAARGLYDFDDMIIRAIQSLEKNADLRYTLQEQYLYILLDEFQDTNAAQLKLVKLLSDNPVHENRPNIMAVGDDDQAIYAFQGAQYSNMLDFYRMYRDVQVINLTKNYRSHADILLTAQNVSEQINERLHHNFDAITKTLTASNETIRSAHITRTEFLSDIAQYDWIASRVKQLIDGGTSPKEIAVLAPRHKQLEPLVAYLNALDIPVRYEKRENILESTVVKQLLSMSRLVLALQENNQQAANALWPEVLSYEFWNLPTSKIWNLSWEVNDKKDESATWSKFLLENDAFREPALLFLALAQKSSHESCETILDYLTGNESIETGETDNPTVRSKLKDFYTSQESLSGNPEIFYQTLSHLRVLRAKLRDHQAATEKALKLRDLISFVEMYENAEQRMINTSPYNQRSDAVQLMTVFKAKGLEFEHVFLPCCHDDVWGSSSRGSSNRLTLPPNLAPIRHAGVTDDERLRILFVALTRAKFGLHLTNFLQTYSGKATKRLKYFNEQDAGDGSFKCMVLPADCRQVIRDGHTAPELQKLELDWRQRHIAGVASSQLRDLLDERIKRYKLSPTHLNTFTDTEYGGPQKFFMHTLLRFPQAPGVSGQYGNAIHETLEAVQYYLDAHNKLPALPHILGVFGKQLERKHLTTEQYVLEHERGERALKEYMQQRGSIFKQGDKAEHGFSHEGVIIGEAHMGGKIDRMEIHKADKTIAVVDYKTGSSYTRWEKIAKLHKYRVQLYCYKLLIENSHTFAGYTVKTGRLEFVEPDRDGKVNYLETAFDNAEVARIKQLLQVMWQKIHMMDFPDTSKYTKDLKGIQAFEEDLLTSHTG